VRIGADSLDQLPAGAVKHPSVKALPADQGGGIVFPEGGIVLPVEGHLTAASGTVDLTCRVGESWPPGEEQALFYLGSGSQSQVALLVRRGSLAAVYGGGTERSPAIQYGRSRQWEPGSRHRLQFSWQAEGPRVNFLLCVDGQLVGLAEGSPIEEWPQTCSLGAREGAAPWGGVVEEVSLSLKPLRPPELQPGERAIRIEADRPVGTCYPFWTVGNFNAPHRFIEPGFRESVQMECPFVREVNAVYLLGGRYEGFNEWFQGLEADGSIRVDFTGMVAQLKSVLDCGFTPRVVLDNVPFSMSDPPLMNAFGNTAPPKDERIWHQYVQAAIREMVKAFGRETVGKWSFRVGTEPDLRPGHWAGTKEQYLAHYDHTVDAVTSVLPEVEIGPGNILNPESAGYGPRMGVQWGLDIIDHAATGTNACTGGQGTRMSFFTCSWYGRVGGPVSGFDHAVEAIRSRLSRYPQFANVPVDVGEFAVLADENGRRLWAGDTTEWSASFYAALADHVYARGVRKVYEWDEATMGVLHPRGQVIGMLARMEGGQRLAVDVGGPPDGPCGAIACGKDGRLFVLLYNHRTWRQAKVPETVHLEILDGRMKQGQTWHLSEWPVDAEHTVWAYAFDADAAAAGLTPLPRAGKYEGSPLRYYGEPGVEVFQKNIATYRKLSELPQTRRDAPLAVADGRASLELVLPGHSVRLLELSAP
jgi:xylan 1,4-beta-xylosidase